jgi:DNA replication protein DnaC
MIETIKAKFKSIRCYHLSKSIEVLLEQARNNELSYLEYTQILLDEEMHKRETNRIERYKKKANFPVIKTFEEFDFKFQTSITKREIKEWQNFDWIERRCNKIFMGPPGVGKTHLAIALGYSAVLKQYKVKFYTMNKIMEDMILAEDENNFDAYLEKLLKKDLIIIDELGYLPLNPKYSHLFFRLINECYEYRSLIITSNKLFSEWDNVFGDQTVATAILDRLLHHAEPLIINGDSYRLKDTKDIFDLNSNGKYPNKNVENG